MTARDGAVAIAGDVGSGGAARVIRLLSPAVRDRMPGLAAALLDGALMLALLIGLARLAWLLASPAGTAADSPGGAARAAAPGQARELPVDVAAITAAHLFGRASAPASPRPPAPASAPVALALRGVLLSDLPDATRALIAREGGADVAYAPGATLPGGARLMEVRAAEVVIWRDARTETLRLNRAPGEQRTAQLEQVDHRDNQAMARQLADLQRQLQRDPASSVGLLRFEPLHRQGRLIGFRVNPGRAQGLLASLGLRPGDVISAVNGIALESIPNGFDALEQLTSADEVRLDIARGDTHLVYAYRIAR